MERLIVKNFGPIKDIDIEIKDVNVLIGTTASGKSTVAKLWAVFNSDSGAFLDSIQNFNKALNSYNIDFEIKENTTIKYSDGLDNSEDFDGEWIWELERMEIQNRTDERLSEEEADYIRRYLTRIGIDLSSSAIVSNKGLLEEIRRAESQVAMHYIPAERSIFAMVGSSIFGLLKNDVTIPDCVKDFGAQFEVARKKFPELRIPMLSLTYKYENLTDYVVLDDGTKLRLAQASSGVQSVVPAYVVLHSLGETKGNCQIIIEEPELNLYPNTQKDFLEYLVRVTNKTRSKLFITTHSPYILTSLDNLVQAHNVVRKFAEKENDVEAIIDKDLWLDFDNITCYFFDNGTCSSTLNEEYRSIGATAIDDVSDAIGEQFDALIKMEYAE